MSLNAHQKNFEIALSIGAAMMAAIYSAFIGIF